MTQEELNYIKDAFSQIIDDIGGNPDWYEAARAVASDLGTLERELEKKVYVQKGIIMTKSDTISNLKAYLDGDTAIGNIIPLRSVLESAVGYLETPQETIKGWVARDEDGTLVLGRRCPERINSSGTWTKFAQCMKIDKELFPDLRCENEPKDVELIIRPL